MAKRKKILSPQDSKKKAQEELEQIEVLGQESEEKAVKWVQEVGKEQEHIEQEKSAEEQWKLSDARKKPFTYNHAILNTCRRRMIEYDEFVPRGFTWIARYVEKERGLEILIRDPRQKFHVKALRICGDPMYDLNWIDNNIQIGLNFMEELDKKYTQNTKKFEYIKDGKKFYL